ncbi:MAG TPA: sugar ABC transporter substrate-binding protein [Anaerolineae bacterium]|nr:sugar ABC transporter substrate-binding protein [Anaerolineae bacterium]HMR67762.1 sugar ABC transporter substrate-binding protein [Anaerolineae bacterium]
MKNFLGVLLIAGTLATLTAACGAPAQPQTVVETVIVVETVEVEKEVEVVVTATPNPEAEAPTAEAADQEVETEADSTEDAKIILRVGTGDSGEGLTPHQDIIAKFEEENPDILVQLEAVAGRDYYARLLTQIAANDAPDVMQIGDDAVPQFVDSGAFLPLDDFINGEYPLDLSIYLPGVLTPGQYNGQQYLLPKDFSPLAVYYNKKVFDEAGVDYPQDGWTWDEFLETAQALTQDTDGDGQTDVWGVQLPGPWTTGFEYWVAATGGSLISEDGSQFVGFLDSPETLAAVQFYADLYNTYQVAPPPADMNVFGGGNSEFDNGQAAMRIFGRWPQSGIKENPNIDLGLVGMPQQEARANVLFWGGFGIYSGTENPEAAWRFLRFYVGEQGAEIWKDWALPAVAAVADESGLTDDPIEGVWLNELNYLAPRAYTYTPFWGEVADPALRRVLETALLDPEADLETVLAEEAQNAQSELELVQ